MKSSINIIKGISALAVSTILLTACPQPEESDNQPIPKLDSSKTENAERWF